MASLRGATANPVPSPLRWPTSMTLIPYVCVIIYLSRWLLFGAARAARVLLTPQVAAWRGAEVLGTKPPPPRAAAVFQQNGTNARNMAIIARPKIEPEPYVFFSCKHLPSCDAKRVFLGFFSSVCYSVLSPQVGYQKQYLFLIFLFNSLFCFAYKTSSTCCRNNSKGKVNKVEYMLFSKLKMVL